MGGFLEFLKSKLSWQYEKKTDPKKSLDANPIEDMQLDDHEKERLAILFQQILLTTDETRRGGDRNELVKLLEELPETIKSAEAVQKDWAWGESLTTLTEALNRFMKAPRVGDFVHHYMEQPERFIVGFESVVNDLVLRLETDGQIKKLTSAEIKSVRSDYSLHRDEHTSEEIST
uniref:Uncharacterized protein n=1 Tax=Aplanochytrium stocchinoi TaxID=215587 RepID=A0A7S3PHX1_9STRA|mmetsp:Transcript_7062/g.8939  ORF Transcript_7062/g.8939 Transcript_7062/m.8939 type:complete len:175 (+) Transcript_7062:123-647(+)|eukprot:CAMPEP_0204837906 /NCGR_PEP_ID=MMETSP1346-20131115/29319_1 /ASSEMBLY_ACC=CAM_ASM_000771 /TAXON_ID=215587 /ORGANISM="Aplanochytrium stocchinoi, Strain GSBS06" /LENGTH=174 /DNA_ID=CAMNT_0051973637 /DNA_START=414 /DNA_END=938 /DNA_ORIENTATION=-